MSGANYNTTDNTPNVPIYIQGDDGGDNATDLNTATYTSVPIFTESSVIGTGFTVTSTTEITVNFNGILKLWSNTNVKSTGSRVSVSSRFFNNGVAFGPYGNASYCRNNSLAEEGMTFIQPFFTEVNTGDVITLRFIRVGSTTTFTFFYGDGLNFCYLQRIT